VVRRWCVVLLVIMGLFLARVAPSAHAESCQFVLGFATLEDIIPQQVGQCMENEQHNPETGNGLQRTTDGLLVWRKADNITAFTDGYRTWVDGPHGLEERLNTQRFAWEANPAGFPVIPDASVGVAQTPVAPDIRQALQRFMVARLQRQDQAVLGFLTRGLRVLLDSGQLQVPVLQVSNPCWYRYELVSLQQPTSTTAAALVRIYQHFWGGDAAGGPPSSWEQAIDWVETGAGWRVDQLGPQTNERAQPGKPRYGSAHSACAQPGR